MIAEKGADLIKESRSSGANPVSSEAAVSAASARD